ncbi:MAG TPA: STM4012 family radical SAM protein [Pirellulales bacterium]|nr:STM4012 family radical SAM protein [Pirellulales bacterium]
MSAAAELPQEEEFESYAYSYPHKSSYRPLSPPAPLREIWRDENRDRLSLYMHIPFCEMRCGFCNLFTQSQPQDDLVSAYLSALTRQMQVVFSQVPGARFSQFAMGGGTPTFLSAAQLEQLLSRIETFLGHSLRPLLTSVETSPATATRERLQVLADHGIRRISMGVQSFNSDETRRIGRPWQTRDAYRALDAIRRLGFPTLNIDLIYGGPEQTIESWRSSLREALRYLPEELYLYPLYVRPDTGLAKTAAHRAQRRHDLYLAARDLLRERGYLQASLRCFHLPSRFAADHVCQRDGMIGLGCGARSYTRQLHYATRFAVTQSGVRAILKQWMAQTAEEMSLATHGIWLSEDEQCRRFVILSLLDAGGLSVADFRRRFPSATIEAISGFDEVVKRGWAVCANGRYLLTPEGMQWSDVLGPLLYSSPVLERLRRFSRLPTLAKGAVGT